MIIEWKGHSSFLLTSVSGVRLLTDPFDGQMVGYSLPQVEAEVVTISHQHGDHNAAHLLPVKPVTIEGVGEHEAAGIIIKGVATDHDSERGVKRGANTVFTIKIDELAICHLGDLGHLLTAEQIAAIGPVDALFIPVGGYYTIDAQQAYKVVEQLQPALVFPMHYKLDQRVKLPIAPVDEFIRLYEKVSRQKTLLVDKASLPKKTEVMVLEVS